MQGLRKVFGLGQTRKNTAHVNTDSVTSTRVKYTKLHHDSSKTFRRIYGDDGGKYDFDKFCSGVKSSKLLYTKLEEYNTKLMNYIPKLFTYAEDTKQHSRKIYIRILPYCCEQNVPGGFDYANNPKLKKKVKDMINTKFINSYVEINYKVYQNVNQNVNQNKYILNNNFIKNYGPFLHSDRGKNNNDTYYLSEYSPQKFYDLLKTNLLDIIGIQNYKYSEYQCKSTFIVSHSHFIEELTRLITGYEIYFDNLDICQITLKESAIRGQYAITNVSRWKYGTNYTKDTIRTFTLPEQQKTSGNTQIQQPEYKVFLMRHCPACNNSLTNIKDKAAKVVAQEYGYSKYGLCSPYTITELFEKRDQLLAMFAAENVDIKNDLTFGTSIILRAILTTIIFANIILGTPKQTDKTDEIIYKDLYNEYGFLDAEEEEEKAAQK